MKAALLSILLLAVDASAQILRPIDPKQIADVTGKKADLETLKFDTLQQPTQTEPVTPLSGKMRTVPATIANKQVNLPESPSFEMVPTKTIPHQNFTAKRATLPDNLPAMTATKPPDAKINQRVIKPFTPAGSEELKKQLNTPH